MDVTSGLDRRVTHVENETVHIYDLIEERAAEVRLQFDSVRLQFDSVQLQFDSVNRTLGEHTQTLSEHGDALAEILRRLPEPR